MLSSSHLTTDSNHRQNNTAVWACTSKIIVQDVINPNVNYNTELVFKSLHHHKLLLITEKKKHVDNTFALL